MSQQTVNRIKKVAVRNNRIWVTMESGLRMLLIQTDVPVNYDPQCLVGMTVTEAIWHNHEQLRK